MALVAVALRLVKEDIVIRGLGLDLGLNLEGCCSFGIVLLGGMLVVGEPSFG